MFGLSGWTEAMIARSSERQRELSRRVDAIIEKGASSAEAYMRVIRMMEHEEWDRAEQIKLADIRENGT